MVTFEKLHRELISEVCPCGHRKRTGFAFCAGCYFKLPEAYRTRLWLLADSRKSHKAQRLIYWRCLVRLGLRAEEKEVYPCPAA